MGDRDLQHYLDQITVARTEIKNLRQKLSSMKQEHQKEMETVKAALSSLKCSDCSQKATTIATNSTQSQPTQKEKPFQPIGLIETSFQNKRAVPRQPSVLKHSDGIVVIDTSVFNNPEHALEGLDEYSHMWIIFHFHATDSTSVLAKVSPPRLQGERRGVFSTRSPHRPCPIGLSLVKIVSVQGNKIHFKGVDMVNGTPVLDIKPYIPEYDSPNYNHTDRPMTEGISDAAESMADLSLQIDSSHNNAQDTRIPTPNHSQRPERGSPDGQELCITTPSWLNDRVSYKVSFTERSVTRLNDLIGDRSVSFRSNIESLLSQDPRSNYVRTKYPNSEYNCVLEDVSLSCVFDEASKVCTIVAVRSADEINE